MSKIIKSKLGRVLIVDDEIESLTPLCDLLSEWGYEVAGCTSGKEALKVLKEQDFDLLLTDLVMPEMDGIELLKAALGIDPHLVGIIITGKDTIQTAVEAMKVGAFDYILKPIKWKILCAILSRAMEVRRLRKSEERYRTIVEDYQTEFICRFLPDGTLTFVNEAFCCYFNKKREELFGQSFMQIIPEEDQELVRQNLASLSVENPVMTIEHRVLAPNGEIRWRRCTNRAIFDGLGSLIEFQSVGRDITERKRAEEALREAKEFSESLITLMKDGFSVLDSRGVHIDVNPALCQMTGFSREELIGVGPPHPYWPPEAYEDMERAFRKTVQGEFNNFELTFMRKNGERFPVIVSPSWMKDKQGNVISYLSTVKDITERKRAEERIKLSLKEKEILLKEIHHRVKNNLQIVSSLLNLQSRNIKDKQTLEMFRESQNRIRSMTLVHEKLYQSKDLAMINIADYVRTLAADLVRSYGDSSKAFIKINAKGVLMDIDMAIPCGLIINELISNSLKHAFPEREKCSESSDSKHEIHIDIHSRNNMYTLIVSDNGVGLPKDFSLENAVSLGLRLVSILANQLKGNLEIDCKGGTTFKLTFAG